MILIQESFTEADRKEGVTLVTPQSFSSVKKWQGEEVDGISYYVKKAVSLGAKAKKKPSKKVVKEPEADKVDD